MATDLASLGLRVDSRQVRTADRDLDRFGRSAATAERSTGRLRGGMVGLARGAGAAAGALAAAALAATSLGAAVRVIAEFDRSMAQVSAITGATNSELMALREVASDLGASTEFSASQAAGGLRFLGMAGFSASESIAAIPAVLDLATAASMDLASAADTSSNIMSAFGLSAERAGDVADVLAAASSRANTDVGQLGSAMSFVGPVASAMGVDLGDAAAAVGVLSDAGIQGSAAGTGLRRVLSSLANPTGAAAEALRNLGISLADVNPATNEIVAIVDALAAAGLSAADALTIFGDRGGPAILALTSQTGRLRELTGELADVEGEASRMAETMRDNLGGDLDALWSSVQGFALALGDAGLASVLRGVIQALTAFIRNISLVARQIGDGVQSINRFFSATARSEQAVNDLTSAMHDQLQESSSLFPAIQGGTTLTLNAAQARVQETIAIRQTIQALADERAERVRGTAAYQDVVTQIGAAQQAIDYIRREEQRGRGGTELFVPNSQAMQRAIEDLRTLIDQRQRLVGLTGDETAEVERLNAQISLIQEAIERSTTGVVSFGDGVDRAGGAASALSATVGGIDMSRAIAGAQALADRLGVSLGIAQSIAVIAGGAGGVGDEVFDPRSPHFNQGLQDRANAEAELARIRQSFEDTQTGTARSGGPGGGGGAASAAQEVTAAMRAADAAIRQAEQAALDFGSVQSVLDQRLQSGQISTEQYVAALAQLEEQFASTGSSAMQEFEGYLQSLSASMADAIVAGEDMGEALRTVFQQIARDLIASGLQGLLSQTFGAFGLSGGGGGFLSGLFGGSFEGGGFTGSGGRTGGIDGRGGFPAILHPNETVIDHTRSGPSGGGNSEATLRIAGLPDGAYFQEQRILMHGIAINVVAENNRMQSEQARRSAPA